MKLIICRDENNGILFRKKRLSRDSSIIEKIISLIGDNQLIIGEYSKGLFTTYALPNIFVANATSINDNEGYIFIENNLDILENESLRDSIDTVIIFNWNRHYPSTTKLDKVIDLSNFNLESTEDFKGTSHDKITMEVYKLWRR